MKSTNASSHHENMSPRNNTHTRLLFKAAAAVEPPSPRDNFQSCQRVFSGAAQPGAARRGGPVGVGGGSEKTSPPFDGVFTWAVGVGEDGTN